MIGIGALLDQSFDRYRTHFLKLMKVSAWLLVVVLINIIAISIYPFAIGRETTQITGLETFGLVLFLINNFILGYIVFRVWILNGLLILGDNPSEPMARVSQKAWRLFWPQLWPHILVGLVFLVSTVLPLLAIWFISGVLSDLLPTLVTFLLLFLCLTLFLIPIALLFYLVFVPMEVVYEGKRGYAALKTSALRVHDHFWSIVARTLVPKFLYFGVLFLLQWLLLFVFQAFISVALSGADLVTLARVDSIVTMATYAIGVVLLFPLILTTDIVLYKSLRSL